MEAYRGRPGGNNPPYVPDIAYDGRMDDELALEGWLLALADAALPR